MHLVVDAHRRSCWLLSSTEAPPVPCRRVVSHHCWHSPVLLALLPALPARSAPFAERRPCRLPDCMGHSFHMVWWACTLLSPSLSKQGHTVLSDTRESREALGMRLMLDAHRRSWWLLSRTEAPPVPFRRVLPSLLAVPSLACSVASLSLCPGGYLPDQHPLQGRGLAGCQIAWDTSSTWSGKHALELQLLHLQAHSDRTQLPTATASWSYTADPK